MLESAEQAAISGNLSSADELLRGAARIQEAELGPLHPDLANTLNNLAIVAEKTGRLSDAETFYRRAAGIASASLPADHQMVIASRQNLEDFCHARGLPVDAPTVMNLPAHETELGLDAFAREGENVVAATSDVPVADEVPAAGAMALADDLPLAAPSQPAPSRRASRQPAARQPAPSPSASTVAPPPVSRGASRTPLWITVGVIALVAAVLLMMRPWSQMPQITQQMTGPQTTEPATAPSAAPPPQPASPSAEATSPREQAPAVAPPADDRGTGVDTPPAPAPSAGAATLAVVQLCRTLSTGTGAWRCDAVADPVAPGPLVYYTRVRSARDGVVVHQWYQGDTLRKSVKLAIKASPREGYRTYSRQTVDAPADWRVEVRNTDGALLHEQRFAVR